jgi:uncharacterized protein
MQDTIILLLVGLAAGALSGLLGVGGGIIVIPALVGVLGYSQQEAQGTSLGLLLPPIGALAVYNYYEEGFVNVKAALIMAATFLAGSYLTSKIAADLPEAYLKNIFGVFLLIYGGMLVFEK